MASKRWGLSQRHTIQDVTYNGSNPGKDPLFDEYSSNDAIVREDSVVLMVLYFLQAKLFSSGFMFMRDGQTLATDSDRKFSTFVQHYLTPFCHKALPFMIAHGYLVWYMYQPDDADELVPDVPDFELLSVTIRHHESNASTVIKVEWINEEYKDTLYVFNTQSPFGITPMNPNSPVDRVKMFLRSYYALLENRNVATNYNSRPPLALQHVQPRSRADPGRDSNLGNYDDELERQMQDNLHAMGMDNFYIDRIKALSAPEKQTYQQSTQPVRPQRWWLKSIARQRSRPETRFMLIPGGLAHVATPAATFEPEFVALQTTLLESIFNEFGIPYSAILTSSARQTATGIELHKTMLMNTLQTWWSLFSTVLTDVYRVKFGIDEASVTSTAPVRKKRKTDDEEKESEFTEKRLKTAKGLVTVHLKSSFVTSPEQALALYHEGVIAFDAFQRLRLEAVGLPATLADPTVKPPMRQSAQTLDEAVEIKERIAVAKTIDAPNRPASAK